MCLNLNHSKLIMVISLSLVSDHFRNKCDSVLASEM